MSAAKSGAAPRNATRADRPRVVQLGKYYAPDVGGIESLTRDLGVGFVRAGWRSEIVVFSSRRAGRDTDQGSIVTRCRIGFGIDTQPVGAGWLARAVAALHGADVVILHAPNPLGALVAALVRRAPLILFWHSDVLGKRWLGRLVAPLEQAVLARADIVWVTSPEYAQASPALRRWREKVRPLPPGIPDPVALGPAPPLDPRIAAFIGARRLILAIGRLVPYKGFDHLVHAAAQVDDDAALLIVGDGPQRPALADLVASLGLGHRVLLAGRLGSDQLRAAFRAADLFVMSSVSRSEAFGLVQLEAMAHGKPVVATDIPGSGAPAASGRGALGALVPVADPPALAAAINGVLAADRTVLAARARARFEALFTLDRMTDQACADAAGLRRPGPAGGRMRWFRRPAR